MQAYDLLLLQAALGLSDRWQVTSAVFDRDARRRDLLVVSSVGRLSAARSATGRG